MLIGQNIVHINEIRNTVIIN